MFFGTLKHKGNSLDDVNITEPWTADLVLNFAAVL